MPILAVLSVPLVMLDHDDTNSNWKHFQLLILWLKHEIKNLKMYNYNFTIQLELFLPCPPPFNNKRIVNTYIPNMH